MITFALANNKITGGYYIASDRASMVWQELPHDLVREVEDVQRKGEKVEEVSIGLNGDWFLRSNARHEHTRKDMISNVEKFTHHMQQASLSLADYAMQFFTFFPDPTGYITVLHKTDKSLTRCAWHNVPEKLDKLLERVATKGVRHVTVGGNDSFVVLMNTGEVLWSHVPESLHRLLDDAKKSGRAVVTVSLSLIADSWYFVEFADGTTKFFLPPAWHGSINKITGRAMRASVPRMTTSYNSVPSPPPSTSHRSPQIPQQGRLGSYAPVGSSGQAKSRGSTPVPQRQPVTNITHVHNYPAPQALQRPAMNPPNLKRDGMVTLLNGALKVACAVLLPSVQSLIGRAAISLLTGS